jgi:hypothetical protein
VFDDLTNVILLNVLDENELFLALDVEVDEDVLVTNEKSQFVRGKRDVLSFPTVAVNDRGDVVGDAKLAGCAFSERLTNVRLEVVYLCHDFLSRRRVPPVVSTRTPEA